MAEYHDVDLLPLDKVSTAKSPKAFKTISEISESLDLSSHVLRFWETKFNQIKPLKRSGGRRYYRPDDVELIRVIKMLLYVEGYTIKGVQRVFKENGVRVASQVGKIADRLSKAQPVDDHKQQQPNPLSTLKDDNTDDLKSGLDGVLHDLKDVQKYLNRHRSDKS